MNFRFFLLSFLFVSLLVFGMGFSSAKEYKSSVSAVSYTQILDSRGRYRPKLKPIMPDDNGFIPVRTPKLEFAPSEPQFMRLTYYYTPVAGQSRYYNRNYKNDYAMNCQGNCFVTADGTNLQTKSEFAVLACPGTGKRDLPACQWQCSRVGFALIQKKSDMVFLNE